MDFTQATLKEAIDRLYTTRHGLKEADYPKEALFQNLLALMVSIEGDKYRAAYELEEAAQAYEIAA